ncbi:MAG: TIGR00269 family protein [Candidatus Bathyarchaeota archaeon]|nr:TIGR00269 family protein [Candidatus Bathyarchaeota archaeon]
MAATLCTCCKRKEAFYFRQYSGERLCRKCFAASIEAKVRATITRHHMLRFDDHLAVAVSGGKDSLAILYILAKLRKHRPKTTLTAVTVDEGIKGYRDEALDIATKLCKKLEVPHHIVSFKELYGFSLDEIVAKAREKGQTELTACAYCGVMRRRAINVGARQVKADKVATGHTLDDEAQTVLMNILRGDIARLAKEKPVTSEVHPLFVQKIKPFCEIPEKESALYAYVKKIDFQDTPCPYASEALRNDIRGMLNRMEEKHAGTKFTVARAIEKLRPAIEENLKKEDFKTCKECGEPSALERCKTCEMLHQIR